MSTAMLAGHRVTHARSQIPAFGIWWAEAMLDEEVELSGRVNLQIADLTLSGTIMSGGPGPRGRSMYRLAGGAGKWGMTIPPWSYANDAGVKASIVLDDAARACGETIDLSTVPDRRLGPGFARPEEPAARVLEQLFPAGWYVGEDGVTRVGQRIPAELLPDMQVAAVDVATGTVELSAESIASLLPGVTVQNVKAVDVLHELGPTQLRTKIWGAGIAPTSRRLASLRRLVEQLDPRSRFRGIYEYRLITQTAERVTIQPIRVSTGMPNLQRVHVRPGVAGARSDIAIGSRLLVSFVDCDPARPIVIGFEDAQGETFLPDRTDLDANDLFTIGTEATLIKIANGTLGIARETDPVIAGPFSGTVVSGSLRARCG